MAHVRHLNEEVLPAEEDTLPLARLNVMHALVHGLLGVLVVVKARQVGQRFFDLRGITAALPIVTRVQGLHIQAAGAIHLVLHEVNELDRGHELLGLHLLLLVLGAVVAVVRLVVVVAVLAGVVVCVDLRIVVAQRLKMENLENGNVGADLQLRVVLPQQTPESLVSDAEGELAIG